MCELDPAGEPLERKKLAYTTTDLRRLIELLDRHHVDAVGIERPDGPVVDALLAAGHTVYVLPAVAGQGAAPPLRVGRQQGRSVRRLRARRHGAHRPAPIDPAAARRRRDDREEELARRVANADLSGPGMELVRRPDIVNQLSRIRCPTLVCVGTLDPVTPVAAAKEIVNALPPQLGQLEVIDAAGHFPWLDRPESYWSIITTFATAAGGR